MAVLPAPDLSDGVVRVRPFGPGDVAHVLAACADPSLDDGTQFDPSWRRADAEAWLPFAAGRLAVGEGVECVLLEHDVPVGSVRFVRVDWDFRRGEVGYWLLGEARG